MSERRTVAPRRVLTVDLVAGESLDIKTAERDGECITVRLVHKSGGRARLMVMARETVKVDHVHERGADVPHRG